MNLMKTLKRGGEFYAPEFSHVFEGMQPQECAAKIYS